MTYAVPLKIQNTYNEWKCEDNLVHSVMKKDTHSDSRVEAAFSIVWREAAFSI